MITHIMMTDADTIIRIENRLICLDNGTLQLRDVSLCASIDLHFRRSEYERKNSQVRHKSPFFLVTCITVDLHTPLQ